MAAGRPCHECVGTVEASTVPQFEPGQRVIALIQTGGLVERAVIPAELLVPLPDADIDPALWVLCQPMGTVMYSVHRIGSVLGKRVVVVGAGPIGLCFTDLWSAMARARSSSPMFTTIAWTPRVRWRHAHHQRRA